MPVGEADPWRLQYFAQTACPDDVLIPTEDSDCWRLFPRHRWIYDRLAVALAQGLEAAPHGVVPATFPVFSKPIINLRGMGIGSRAIPNLAAYSATAEPGHFWMPLLSGKHVSSDVALVDGRPVWWRHATGKPAENGMFDYWTIHAEADPAIESGCGARLAQWLEGYTGMANIETIGGAIIEAHLRFADQWPDLYGDGWVGALVDLYVKGAWNFRDRDRRDGFSLALFGPHGRRYRHPPASVVDAALAISGVTSIQISFHDDRPPEWHAMPPGGFRLAIVNCVDIAAGRVARETLRAAFLGSEPASNTAAG
jgi:hypothetical protein